MSFRTLIAGRLSALTAVALRSAFVRTVGMSSVATALRIVLGLFSTKIIAVFAGPSGIAAIGQLQSFLALQSTIASGGISNGIVTHVSSSKDDKPRLRAILGNATLVTLVFASGTAIATLAFRHALAQELLGDPDKAYVFTVSAAVVLIGSAGGIVGATMNGQMMIGRLMLTGMAGTVMAFLITIGLVIARGADGAVLATVIAGALGASVTMACAYRWNWLPFADFWPRYDAADTKRLLQFTVMTFVSGIFSPISLILVRNVLQNELSMAHVGYWQSIWRISEVYIQIVTIPLSTYYLPRLAAAGGDAEMGPVIRRSMALITPVVAVMALAIWSMKDVIVHLLYTPEFLPMRDLFAFQMIGDVLKIASWLISLIMVVRSMTRLLIVTDLIFHSLFVLLVFLFVRMFGFVGASYAFALNYFLYFVTMAVLFRTVLLARPGRA
ncbi:MAG: O-antigen translocase [Alsobacter sp.]